MSASKKGINRSAAFWFGLILHLALAGALYAHFEHRSTPARHVNTGVQAPALP